MDAAAGREKLPFEELYRRYYSNLLFYTLRKVGSREDAEDLVAEAFAYCLRSYDRYDPDRSAESTWLYLVLNSLIKNYYRGKAETVELDRAETLLSGGEDELLRSVWLQQLRGTLCEAISRLPERQQRIVVLRYFKDKSYAEIGEELDISPGNARVLLSRSLDCMEKYLKEKKQFK